MVVSCCEVLRLYKLLLCEASKFPMYYFRMYALRKIRDTFEENKHLKDSAMIEEKYKEGLKSLELIKRQFPENYADITSQPVIACKDIVVIVSQLYNPGKLIIEKIHGQR